jgi:hypothetical protein
MWDSMVMLEGLILGSQVIAVALIGHNNMASITKLKLWLEEEDLF